MSNDQERLDEEEAEQVEAVRPPDLNQESDRSATRLELFFDLAFVLFVARCADVLAKDETWHGALVFCAVLTIGWWAWAVPRRGPAGRPPHEALRLPSDSTRLSQVSPSSSVSPCGAANHASPCAISLRSHRSR